MAVFAFKVAEVLDSGLLTCSLFPYILVLISHECACHMKRYCFFAKVIAMSCVQVSCSPTYLARKLTHDALHTQA